VSALKSVEAVLDAAIAEARARRGGEGVVLIGVGGAQGSGKSTHCRALAAASGGKVAQMSLDDVYFTRAERESLAEFRHPLFMTRGPPGTHDLRLLKETIRDLSHATPDSEMRLPRFDKAADDRAPVEAWPVFRGRPEAILLEGWCLGAKRPASQMPGALNALEAQEDEDGRWRKAVLLELAQNYTKFFANWFDDFVFLQAPSFATVRRWRREQEEETLGRALSEREVDELDRFIEHFERITLGMMEGDHGARWVVKLGEKRNVVSVERQD
jgi:D-glycerate 3-kinase